jgi:hypothetical protein
MKRGFMTINRPERQMKKPQPRAPPAGSKTSDGYSGEGDKHAKLIRVFNSFAACAESFFLSVYLLSV